MKLFFEILGEIRFYTYIQTSNSIPRKVMNTPRKFISPLQVAIIPSGCFHLHQTSRFRTHQIIRDGHLQGVTSELDMAIPWRNQHGNGNAQKNTLGKFWAMSDFQPFLRWQDCWKKGLATKICEIFWIMYILYVVSRCVFGIKWRNKPLHTYTSIGW